MNKQRFPIFAVGLLHIACYAIYGLLDSKNFGPFLISYGILNLSLFISYGIIAHRAYSGKQDLNNSGPWLYFFPLVFIFINLFIKPIFSIDLYSYISHGALIIEHNLNPYTYPAAGLPPSSLRSALLEWGWMDVHGYSPYGPLWTHYEKLLFLFFPKISTALFVEKITLSVFFVGTACFISKTLSLINSSHAKIGVFLFLWNPFIIFETISEGHNDIVMIFFAVAGFFFLFSKRYGQAIFWSGIGILSKYLSLILLPFQVAFFLNHEKRKKPYYYSIILSVSITLCVGSLLFYPFWTGLQTFNGVIFNSLQVGASLLGVIFNATKSWPFVKALSSIIAIIFLCFVFFRSFKIKTEKDLILSCALLVFIYIFFVSAIYWPWYSLFPLTLLCLYPDRKLFLIFMILSFTPRVVAPIDLMQTKQFFSIAMQSFLTCGLAALLPSILFLRQFKLRS